MDLVRKGLCDPFKLFVKEEPHKLRKLNEGRVRLIFNASLVDNTIARMLSALQNNTEIIKWPLIPSKPGMGLNDAGIAVIIDNVARMALDGPVAESDVKGWDWSVQEWELKADLERRLHLNRGYGTVWERVARSHWYCMSRKLMVLSDGTMYQQLQPGVMPSGWYNTSSTNSFMRSLIHGMVAETSIPRIRPAVIAMGDDALEQSVPNAKARYEKLGHTVDMYNDISLDRFEFCSTTFTNNSGYPVNVDKQLINLLCYKPVSFVDCLERMNQFSYELRHHPELEQLKSLVFTSGWWVS